MNRVVSKRISRSQLEKMADYLEKYPQISTLSSEKFDQISKGEKAKLWRKMVDTLNAEPLGAKKTYKKWRKCLRDYKCHVKKKYLQFLADPSNQNSLTYLDVRYLALMGYMVDVDSKELSNKDDEHSYSLEDDPENHVTQNTIIPKLKESEQKPYQAPEITTIRPNLHYFIKDDHKEDMERSEVKGSSNENTKRSSEKELSSVETPRKDELSNFERASNKKKPSFKIPVNCELTIKEIQSNKTSPVDTEKISYQPKTSPKKKIFVASNKVSNEKGSTVPKPSPKKKILVAEKNSGGETKSATAVALHAIANELNAKNELIKRKIEIEKEKLQLEKRKIEAFELIAKRLCRK